MENLKVPFRLFGIPIEIKLSFFLMAFIMAYDATRPPILLVEWLGVLLLSVLWHELGHAMAFKAFGLSSKIELYAYGGLTEADSTKASELSTRQSILVSFAGPGAGLLLGGAVYLLFHFIDRPTSYVGQVTLADFLFVNITWSLVNLLPFLPLDGGHIILALFKRWRGETGVLYALGFSFVVAILVAVFAYQNHYPFGALIAIAFTFDNGRRFFQQREFLEIAPLKDKYNALYIPYQAERWSEAEAASIIFLKECKSIKWRDAAIRVLCYSRLKQNNGEGAWEALKEIPPERISAESLQTFEDLFFELNQNETARKIAELRFLKSKNPMAAYNVACGYARLGQTKEALDWLKQAREAGFDDKKILAEDPDLASLRELADWKKLF